MSPQEFIAKWQDVTLTERSACQQHFLDLCELLEQPKPASADPQGAFYTFERGVEKSDGGDGWADVWLRGHFGWEYKGKKKSLKAAYDQLLLYRESLENPPLLVVCDLDRFEIHTNFTSTAKRVYAFDLQGLADPDNLDILRKVFTDPDSLRPGQTSQGITEQAAELFGQLADGMRVRGIPASEAAHFLMKLMFCMFAEDIELLPNKVFFRLLTGAKKEPARLGKLLADLFQAMCNGGNFGADEILYFNGGLFADADVIELRPSEIETLTTVAAFDWSVVEPSVFGTLFERTLDPAKRSQIGAHYTSRQDIETLLQPVMMAPLRREWEDVKAKCSALWRKIAAAGKAASAPKLGPRRTHRAQSPRREKGPRASHDKLLRDFVDRLAHVVVLDPACGSGNFLYVALHLLLDLEKEVITFAANRGVSLLPQVRPTQLHGIEINPYAQQLAQVVIWIGYLQWMRDNGFSPPRNPVLEPIESIRRMDAILDLSDPEHPCEPEWPEAEFIVGNPPFLGGNRIRQGLGDGYVDSLFGIYASRVPAFADLCCYWFQKALAQIQSGAAKRAGLLATQGIRGGVNRSVLDRVKETGDIFFAKSDREWVLDGAWVHVSMVGFDDGSESERVLDGQVVQRIPSNLAIGTDITTAKRLPESANLYHEGTKKGARFELTDADFFRMIVQPNPNGKPNSDVIRLYINGAATLRRSPKLGHHLLPVLDGPCAAAQYESPFEHVREHVFPHYGEKRDKWWTHERARPELIAFLHNSRGTSRRSDIPSIAYLCGWIRPFFRIVRWEHSPVPTTVCSGSFSLAYMKCGRSHRELRFENVNLDFDTRRRAACKHFRSLMQPMGSGTRLPKRRGSWIDCGTTG